MKPPRTSFFPVALLAFLASFFLASCAPTPSVNNTPARSTASVADTPIQSCINLGGALEAPVEGQWGYQIRRQDLTRIARAGFDTVRLPVAWSEHAEDNPPYTISPALFARTDQIIKAALENDLNIILNVHHYWELMRDPNTHEPRLDAIWKQLADHYAGWPDGLVFEFLNEPHKRMTPARVDAMNDRLLGMIRQKHPDRYVILTGGRWGGLEGMMESQPPDDDRVIMSFHYYDPHKFTHQGASFDPKSAPPGQIWGSEQDRQALEGVMSAAALFRHRTGHPVFLGEFGVYADVPAKQRAEWTREVRLAAETRGIGWCYYDWATTFRIYDLERERWVRPVRQALLP